MPTDIVEMGKALPDYCALRKSQQRGQLVDRKRQRKARFYSAK